MTFKFNAEFKNTITCNNKKEEILTHSYNDRFLHFGTPVLEWWQPHPYLVVDTAARQRPLTQGQQEQKSATQEIPQIEN